MPSRATRTRDLRPFCDGSGCGKKASHELAMSVGTFVLCADCMAHYRQGCFMVTSSAWKRATSKRVN